MAYNARIHTVKFPCYVLLRQCNAGSKAVVHGGFRVQQLLLPAVAGEQEDLPVFSLALQKAQGQTQAVIVEHDERVIQQERGILRQQHLFSTRYELIRVGYLVAAYVFRTLAQPAQYP